MMPDDRNWRGRGPSWWRLPRSESIVTCAHSMASLTRSLSLAYKIKPWLLCFSNLPLSKNRNTPKWQVGKILRCWIDTNWGSLTIFRYQIYMLTLADPRDADWRLTKQEMFTLLRQCASNGVLLGGYPSWLVKIHECHNGYSNHEIDDKCFTQVIGWFWMFTVILFQMRNPLLLH